MPNNSSDTHPDGRGEKGQYFAALLNCLCPDDPDEASRRYMRLHRKLSGYFRLKGMSDPDADADDALDRAAEKIAKGQVIPEIDKFCLGIARNIWYERLRAQKREEAAFQKFIDYCLDKTSEAVVERIMKLMKPCWEKLPPDDQNLLVEYCKVPPGVDRAEHRRQLAERRNSTISALRIRVARLRRGLEECMRDLSNKL
jgi:hypothetical protein